MRFSRRAALLALLSTSAVTVASASIQGCSTDPNTVGENTDDHTAGELLLANDPHVWGEVAPADFGRGFSSQGETPVAANDPTTLRLNQWLERFHTIAGNIVARQGVRLMAPKPTAALLKGNGPNAWVSAGLACPSWTLKSPSGGPSGGNYLLMPQGAQVTDMSEAGCIAPANWTDPNAFASYWNRQGNGCSLLVNGTTLTLNGGQCQAYGTQGQLTTYVTSNTIAVTLDAVAWGDEIRVAMTLAHELGHYYRAHSNPSIVKPLGFFYQDDLNGPVRPVPVAQSAQMEQIVQYASRVPDALKFTGTTSFSKRLWKVLVSMKGSCTAAQIDNPTLQYLAAGQASAAQIAQYVAFDAAMGTCLAATDLSDPTLKSKFDDLLTKNRINPAMAAGATSIADALAKITATYDQIDQQEKWLLDQVNNNGLGWYTQEQEADEIGLELATQAGFAPADLITARLRSSEQLENMYKSWGYNGMELVDMPTCKRWLDNNFTEKGADGVTRPIRVPLGSIADNHHEACYRLYNLWREAKKHNYVVAAPLPALAPAWNVIQSRAAGFGAHPTPPDNTPPGGGTTTPPGGGTTTPPGGGTTTPPGGGTTTPPGGGTTTPPGGGTTTPPGGGTTTPPGGGTTTPPGGGTTTPPSGGTTTPPGGGTTAPGGGTTPPGEKPAEPAPSDVDPWYSPSKKKTPVQTTATPDAGAPAAATTTEAGGCSTAPQGGSGSSVFALIAAAALVLVRRRKTP